MLTVGKMYKKIRVAIIAKKKGTAPLKISSRVTSVSATPLVAYKLRPNGGVINSTSMDNIIIVALPYAIYAGRDSYRVKHWDCYAKDRDAIQKTPQNQNNSGEYRHDQIGSPVPRSKIYNLVIIPESTAKWENMVALPITCTDFHSFEKKAFAECSMSENDSVRVHPVWSPVIPKFV